MARTSTGRTPRAMKQKEGNYEAVGYKGRATGIQVKDLGPRDEHGMEPMTGLFSSPEKSPPKRNGVVHKTTTVVEQEEDETMNIGSSTIPEPTEVLKTRNGKTVLPPPKSRSPIKTSLGSAARRSLGPLSSPSRRADQDTPTHRAMSHPPNRRLDFSMSESHSSSKGSASKRKQAAAKVTKPTPTAASGKRKRGVFDIPQDAEDEQVLDETNLTNGDDLANGYDDDQDAGVGGLEDSPLLANGEGPSQIEESQIAEDQEGISPSIERDTTTAAAKKKPGRRGKANNPTDLTSAETSAPVGSPGPSRRGRPSKRAKTDISATALAQAPSGETHESPKKTMQPPKSKRGRQGALALKDPNTRLNPPKTSRSMSTDSKAPLSPSKSRFIARSMTPGDDSAFRTTRAGRNVVKPLAFWRGESAVFGTGRFEEGHIVLPSIKEVIRIDEVAEPQRRKTPGQPRRRPKPQRKVQDDDLPEEEEDEAEYWETEGGVMRASVMLWDPTTGRGDEENPEEAGKLFPPNSTRFGILTDTLQMLHTPLKPSRCATSKAPTSVSQRH
ncbi:MAG: hypothetical protein Q9183_004734 [Haloplaca sp. 2 TL-2023]